jgi:hypothetical protein
MKQATIVIVIAALALASLSCGLTIDLPVDRVTTGPTRTEEINIHPPDAEERPGRRGAGIFSHVATFGERNCQL